MFRPAATVALAFLALVPPAIASAQSTPPPPGPYVIDVRASMAGLPSNGAFHPDLPVAALVPSRGFGADIGGHVYVASLRIARIGIGVDVLRVRGTAATAAAAATSSSMESAVADAAPATLSTADPIDVAATMVALAPQVSVNFGTRDGWSYLSGGYGVGWIRSAASGVRAESQGGSLTLVREDGGAAAINVGGGARWFIKERVGIGFDIRYLRIGPVGVRPSTKNIALSVGAAVR